MYTKHMEAKQLQIHIEFSGNNIDLPISYNYAVQSMIYHALSENQEYQDFLHNTGYVSDKKTFRLFTFGELNGKYTVNNRRIVFEDAFSLEIRTVSDTLFRLLNRSFCLGTVFHLGNQEIIVKRVMCENKKAESNRLKIKMLSPVIAKIKEGNQTIYFAPSDIQFEETINNNFFSKYKAFYGIEPDSQIKLINVYKERKIVSKYKGIWINGYLAEMCIEGKAKYLDFLYNVGIGSNNAQGYGMFEIIK